MLTVEIPAGLADALVETGFLKEWDCENPDQIRRAIEKVLAQLVA
jgi:hypothetical protein